jgi:hypothetical protein
VDRTGWTLPDIYALTIEEVDELFQHWSSEPSQIEFVRALARWEGPAEPAGEPRAKEVSEDQFLAIVADMKKTVGEWNRR